MALRVSTTGTDVFINDLGIVLIHPVLDKDLELQFNSNEIKNSKDLTSAIQSGLLNVDDGLNRIYASDYSPEFTTKRELGLNKDESFISSLELESTGSTYTWQGVFPIGLNSSAAATRNIYSPAGRFATWSISPKDIVVLSGTTFSDGTYTVESVSDQQNLIVIEPILDSTGGVLSIFHPSASTRIGIDSSTLTYSSSLTLQGALEDLNNTSAGSSIKSLVFTKSIINGSDHVRGSIANLSSFNRILGYTINERDLIIKSGITYSLELETSNIDGFDYIINVKDNEWWPGPAPVVLEINLTWE